MSFGLWLISYDLLPEREEAYLDWFHKVHIPEKLARPGYTWAAHYQAMGAGEAGRNRYVALFGGEDSSVFYNPSPEQIKPNQSPETRAMMAVRANPQMFILTREWSRNSIGRLSADEAAISADFLNLEAIEREASDQTLPSSLVQNQWPALCSDDDFVAMHKYLASTGPAKHMVLEERRGSATTTSEGAGILDTKGECLPVISILSAARIWPT